MELTCLEIAIFSVYTLIALIFILSLTDGFANRHAPNLITETRSREIYDNRELFNPSKASYTKVKSKIKWLDPVVYYDIVRLANDNKLSVQNIKGQLG